jgi:hypothetical protein
MQQEGPLPSREATRCGPTKRRSIVSGDVTSTIERNLRIGSTAGGREVVGRKAGAGQKIVDRMVLYRREKQHGAGPQNGVAPSLVV